MLQAAQNTGSLLQILQTIFSNSGISSAAGAALPSLIAFGGGKSIFLATMPSIGANFSSALSAVDSAQRVLMRAEDGKPATIFVGDRYPIDLGLLSSDLTATPSTALTNSLLSGLSLPRTDYDVGTGPVSVAIGNFNSLTNTYPDLAVANQSSGTISILLGTGAGAFATQTVITLPAVTTSGGTINPSPSGIVAADFNNDGYTDLAVTDQANNRVLIFLGNGDGTFQPPVAYTTGSNPVALVAQDFTTDGALDLAVVNQGDGNTASTVSVLLGNLVNGVANGTFAAKTDYAVGVSPSAITTAVFNTGGFTGLAVTNKADNTVSILLGQGTNGLANGTFGAQTTYATGSGPAGIATADFNGDGNPDLAITNSTASPPSVSILLGSANGNGTFQTQTTYATGATPEGIAAATFAGSTVDLAVADEGAENVDILIGNGDGTFTAPISLPVGNSPVALAAGDLIGSGSIDLATVNNASNTVSVTLNTLASSEGATEGSIQTGYPSAQYEDLGLKIKATPRLHQNNEVTLQLQFDIKSLTGTDINGIPILSNRSIEQTVRLRENETSILSGIMQNNKIVSDSGLPWTSSEPGIGYLTGEVTTNIQETELLILVTPRALHLPPHDVPALYAGPGEPSTVPAGPIGGPPAGAAPFRPPEGGRGPGFGGGRPGQAPGTENPPAEQPQSQPAQQPPEQPQQQPERQQQPQERQQPQTEQQQ